MTRVCFATFELHPFSGGGIGTFMYHLLKLRAGDDGTQISVLWYGEEEISERLFAAEFPQCEIYSAKEWAELDDVSEELYPPSDSYDQERLRQSFQLMRALRALEKKRGPFDAVEFTDFGAAAFCTLQEKHLLRAFPATTIAVRVHSTEAMLRTYDHRPASWQNALLYDCERKCFEDADLVVAALNPVAESIRKALNLSPEWREKVIIEPHPFLVHYTNEQRASFGPRTPITFTSKIQWFKRPHIFINGVVAFMRQTPEWIGEGYLLAHVISDELLGHCKSLIPDDLKRRFVFKNGLSNNARNEIISKSLVINPSIYESFCNAAFEASYLGALLVLNRSDPAFGDDTPWIEGVNCAKFDGSSLDLAKVLGDLWARRENLTQAAVDYRNAKIPYWIPDYPRRSEPVTGRTDKAALSVVVLVSGRFGNAMDTVRSVLLNAELDLEICLACDQSVSAAEDLAALRRLEGFKFPDQERLKVVNLGFIDGPAALCDLGLRETRGDYVIFVRAGVVFEPGFLVEAAQALTSNADYSFVIAQVGREAPGGGRPAVNLVYGEAVNTIFLPRNMLGNIEFVGRRKAIEDVGFDEGLDRDFEWDFQIRAAFLGHRSIVSNRIDATLPELHPSSPLYYRCYPDALFVKHGLSGRPGAARLSLASAYDATSMHHYSLTRLPEGVEWPEYRLARCEQLLERYEALRGPKGLFVRAAYRVLLVGVDIAYAIAKSSNSHLQWRLRKTKDHIWNHEYDKIWPTLRGRQP